ncbi:MAG: exodeoxyribonuclease VII small subunit [Bacteroidetes bacterium GWE2_29_8]|nr:MAG: exodeoxyribonuclease VII small subunit [Bacteroidetes bacterium GWE2_29_8]OFY18495.1 MAG: exodeoxyribonuclease VII small subunit [Bacteroidetes bacterium GWF2_29_10]
MGNQINYTDAQKELEQILKEIEIGDVDVDKLSEKVKRACALIRICKEKLKNTDDEIKKILEEFNQENK